VLEVGPSNTQFLGPVLIEVPHFASLRGKEREIVILRSEKGDTWKEHSLAAKDSEVHKALEGYENDDDNNVNSDRRICRIVTNDFPQYFAIISRVRQETNTIGTSGGMLSSTVVPQVQAVFPEGTLTKKIKVGLQAQPVSNEVVKKVLGNRVMVSPIVTIEPRRRKFHKAITVTIPIPNNQGIINGYGGDTPTLRLLCSITGGTSPAQWEDITGTTPLTFVDNCVSFTTTVSARFWLMDCKEIDQASNFARELYHELKSVPFMAKFAVYAKTHDPIESRVRVFCVTDDRTDKTLEQQEHFKEVARSKDVEALEGKPIFIEMAGNLVPVQKSGEQLRLTFSPFHENRLPFFVRVRDAATEPCGRLSFMSEPKVSRGMPPQKAMCNLNITMPPFVKVRPQPHLLPRSQTPNLFPKPYNHITPLFIYSFIFLYFGCEPRILRKHT
jgi:ankyrin